MCKSVNVNSVKGIDSKVMEDKDMLNVVEKLVNWEVSEGFVRGLEHVKEYGKVSFSIEDSLSVEDKTVIMDAHTDGLLSYMLNLIEKFRVGYKSIKCVKDTICFNANSYKAWIRRNDTMDIVYGDGTFRILNDNYSLWGYSGVCYSRKTPDTLVNECFNKLLKKLLKEENQYFIENDSDCLFVEKVCDNLSNYGYEDSWVFRLTPSSDIGIVTKYFQSEGHSIQWHNYADGSKLTIEEVKQLDKALAPVEEKYQAMLRAKEELESALKQAGVDFLDAVGIK